MDIIYCLFLPVMCCLVITAFAAEKLSLRNCNAELQLHPVYVHALRIIGLNGFPFELHKSWCGTVVVALSVLLQQISCR